MMQEGWSLKERRVALRLMMRHNPLASMCLAECNSMHLHSITECSLGLFVRVATWGEVHQPLMPSGAIIIMTSCRYPNTTKKVVEGASLAVTLNSRVAVIGANGAGKSTLIKVLTGESLLTWCGGVLPTVPACLGHYTFPQAQFAFLASKPASAASPTVMSCALPVHLSA